MVNIPFKIYLQIGEDIENVDDGSVTWSRDRINESDVEYTATTVHDQIQSITIVTAQEAISYELGRDGVQRIELEDNFYVVYGKNNRVLTKISTSCSVVIKYTRRWR